MTLHTDGNAIAGVLEEIFGVEVTATMRVCQSCGQEHAIGAHRLYCGDIAAAIATKQDEYRVKLFGTWSEELV